MILAERVLFGSLLLLLVWLPIPLGSNVPWAWSIAEAWIASQTIGLLLVYRTELPWCYIAKFKWLLWPLALFQCWVFLQVLIVPSSVVEWLSPHSYTAQILANADDFSLSVDRVSTKMALLRGIGFWLFLFNCIVLIYSSRRLKVAVATIVLSGTIQAFYGALMVLMNAQQSWGLGYPEVNVATGSFVYKNHLANYLMLCLCLGLGLIIAQLHTSRSGSWHTRIKRWLQGLLSSKMLIRLALVIMVIGLVLTRSRMGNASFFIATTFGGVLAVVLYKNKPHALSILVISILIVDTLIIGTLFGLDKVQQRLMDTSISSESRDQVIVWGLNILKDFPFTGTGMSTFYTIFPSYTERYVGYYDFAHNDYMQFMIEAGIPATLMLGSVIMYVFVLSIKTLRVRQSRTMKGLALGSCMAILGMLLHITVDFNLQPTVNAITFIFVLFVGTSTSFMPPNNEKAFNRPFHSRHPTDSGYV